jgi:hypothetical protein
LQPISPEAKSQCLMFDFHGPTDHRLDTQTNK